MTRSNWKKFTLLLSSAAALILGERIVQACADPGDPYDYYTSFFSNNVMNEKAYAPFFYTANLKYYDEWYDADTSVVLPDQNIAEWRAYTSNTIPEADLDSFVYKYPYSALSGIYYNIEKAKPLQVSKAVADNAFTKWFIENKDLEALGYLMYAKQCEPLAAGNGDYWNPVQRDTAKLGRMERNGLKLHAVAKKDFFKWRYAYQVLRMAFYGGDTYENTIALYDKLIGTATADNIMYPRCLSIKAGALFHTNRKAEAAYLYSKVFDKSDEIKKTAFISYDWSHDSTTTEEDVMKFCKNDHERAVLYVMEGLHSYDDSIEPMQQASRLDPNIRGLNVLMTREINKLEERYLDTKLANERKLSTTAYYYYNYGASYDASFNNDSLLRSYNGHISRLSEFAQKMAQDKKVNNKTFWNLSAAYIAFMQDDAKTCGKYLAKAEKSGMTDRERDQHDIIHILYTLKSNPELNAKTEAKILPELQWLDNRAAKNAAFQKPYRDLMITLIVTPYLKQGDTAKAIFCLARAQRSSNDTFTVSDDFTDIPGSLLEKMDIDKLHSVESFAEKNNKTPYEQWLTKNTPYAPGVLYELEGTKDIRNYNFRDAVAVLRKVPSKRLSNLPNAFAAYIRDQLESEDQDSLKVYTKLSYAEKMLALQQKLEADPKDANAAFEYATGLYSISYYGKAHNAWTYYRGTSDGLGYYDSKERRLLPAQAREFYEVKTAEKYFLQAYENSHNAESKAKALWMAAKCWQKRCPDTGNSSYHENDDIYYKYSLTNPYYSQLKNVGGKTKYYTEVWNTCSYFKDYVKRH